MIFNVRRRFFFCATADLTDHHDRFSLRIFLEQFQDVDKVRAWDRVTADTDTGRLAKTIVGGLLNRFIGQRTGTGNNTHFTRLVNVARHDADFTFARGDNAWAVRADHAYASFIQFHFHGQHIQRWDTFGDGDDQFDACINRFQNGIFTKRCRNVDNGGSCAGRFYRFTYGVEHREAQMRGAAFARCNATDHLRTVSNRLFRVECPLATGEALADNLGIFIN